MAGVDQLAGLVARLEAVAIKLESSGGAGGAGGDAGASVQVQDLLPYMIQICNTINHCKISL